MDASNRGFNHDPEFKKALDARIASGRYGPVVESEFSKAINARIASDRYGPEISKPDAELHAAIVARDGKFGLSHISQLPTAQQATKATLTPVATITKLNAKLALNRAVTGGKFAKMAESEFASLLLECAEANPVYRRELQRCGYLS